jgi:hypothetical protein
LEEYINNMMRYLLVVICVAGFSLPAAAQNKVSYELPNEMSAAVKAEYIKQCDKGKILYDINCANCHTTKVKGKEIIPDFTSEQLIGYELRVLNPKHESEIPETTVTAEELGLIMTFLTYKKKNK